MTYYSEKQKNKHPSSNNNQKMNQNHNNKRAKVPVYFTYNLRNAKSENQQIPKLLSLVEEDYSKCRLCEEHVQKDQMFSFDGCEHLFCLHCLVQYASYKINISEQVECPEEMCRVVLSTRMKVFQVLPTRLQERYKHQCLWRQTLNNPNIRMCPNQNCSNGVIDMTLNPPQCQQCSRRYCPDCMYEYHPGRRCDHNFQAQHQGWKKCPRCHIFIQKDGGCNHMQCSCGYEFCYVCLAGWSGQHYECVAGGVFCCNQCEMGCFFSFLLYVLMMIGAPLYAVLWILVGVVMFALCAGLGPLAGILLVCVIFEKQSCWEKIGLSLVAAIAGIFVAPVAMMYYIYIPFCQRRVIRYSSISRSLWVGFAQ